MAHLQTAAGSMKERDYYELLKIHPSADHEMVAQAYWHLARKYNAASGHDLGAKRLLEELNEAFAVLGSPDQRVNYNRSRAEGPAAKTGAAPRRRVTIEVSFWRLPAWQGTIAATAALALATLALLAGAPLAITLPLAAIAITVALLPAREDWRPSPSKIGAWASEEERRLNTLELERSTAAIIARWRHGTHSQGRARSLDQILAADDACHYPRSLKEPPSPSTHGSEP
jgi:curved DNA-binding protein CbpA